MDFKKDRFNLAADIAVFTILNDNLKLLLIKRKNEPFKGGYALPGGFVEIDENLRQAALRELEEETGVKGVYLKKLHAIGRLNRDPRGRVVSLPFMALIDGENVKLHSTSDAELARWFKINSLPELAFDHKRIINDAMKELKFELQTTNIAFQLMPEKFTLSELQKAYEVILNKQLDKRNFRKKIKSLDLIKPLSEKRRDGAHRPAQLFSFKSKTYQPLSEKMQVFL